MIFNENTLYDILYNIHDSEFLSKIKSTNTFEDTYKLIKEYETFKYTGKLHILSFDNLQLIRYPILSNFVRLYKNYASNEFLQNIKHIDIILELDDERICKDFLVKLVKSFKKYFKDNPFLINDTLKNSLSSVKLNKYFNDQYINLYVQIINLFNKVLASSLYKDDIALINLKKSFITKYILRYHKFNNFEYNHHLILDTLYAKNTNDYVFLSKDEYKYYSYVSSEKYKNISSYVSLCNTFKISKELIFSHLIEVYGMQKEYINGELDNNTYLQNKLKNNVCNILNQYNLNDNVFIFLNTMYDEENTYLSKFLKIPQIKFLEDIEKYIPYKYYTSNIRNDSFITNQYKLMHSELDTSSKYYLKLDTNTSNLGNESYFINNEEKTSRFMRHFSNASDVYEICYVFKHFPDKVRNCFIKYDLSKQLNVLLNFTNNEFDLILSCVSNVYLISPDKSLLDVILSEKILNSEVSNNLVILNNIIYELYNAVDNCLIGYSFEKEDSRLYNFLFWHNHSLNYIKYVNGFNVENKIDSMTNTYKHFNILNKGIAELHKEYNYLYLNFPSISESVKQSYLQLIKEYLLLKSKTKDADKNLLSYANAESYYIDKLNIISLIEIKSIVAGINSADCIMHTVERINALKYYITSDDYISDISHCNLLLQRLDQLNKIYLNKNSNIGKLEYYYILIFLNKYFKPYLFQNTNNYTIKDNIFNSLIYNNSNFLKIDDSLLVNFTKLTGTVYMKDILYNDFKLDKDIKIWNSVQKNELYFFNNYIVNVFNIDQINSMMYFFDFNLLDDVSDTLNKCILLLAYTKNIKEFIFWYLLYNRAKEYFYIKGISIQSALKHFISTKQNEIELANVVYKELLTKEYTLHKIKSMHNDKLNDLTYVLANFTKFKHLYDEIDFECIHSLLCKYVLSQYDTYYNFDNTKKSVIGGNKEFIKVFNQLGVFYYIYYSSKTLEDVEISKIYSLLHVQNLDIFWWNSYSNLIHLLFSYKNCENEYSSDILYFKPYEYCFDESILNYLSCFSDHIDLSYIGDMLLEYFNIYNHMDGMFTVFQKIKYRLLKYNIKKYNKYCPENYIDGTSFYKLTRLYNRAVIKFKNLITFDV